MTNADFEKIVETSDEWIVSRSGIRERRIADESMTTADMAEAASRSALAMGSIDPDSIDVIIAGTVTPDYRLPSLACQMQERIGCRNAVAFDVVAACAGFLNGLSIAQSYIESGMYKRALVIGAEKLSSFTNYKDRNTCVLFGDAAGAVVVEQSQNGSGLLASFMKSDGTYRELLWAPIGGCKNPYTPDFAFDGRDKIIMNGAEVFKVAVREMGRASQAVLDAAGIAAEQLAWVIPHQANIRIIEALAKRLNLPMEKVYINIEHYGNTSSASVPLALDEANRAGKLRSGDYVLMVAIGGGLIWGALLVRW